MVEDEYARTVRQVLKLSAAPQLCDRFPGFRRKFDRVRPMVDRSNYWQVELLFEVRQGKMRDKHLTPLLMTMNCIATGLGWTG